jgi:pimeloyl-ACP methyl ester carboxylesterase
VDQLKRDGHVLRFEDAGKGAPPILLIPDPELGPASMDLHVTTFRPRHRVVLPDLQRRAARGSRAADDLADDLAWLCYELGVYRPVALGHRRGGLVAIDLATRFPDLLAAVVTLDAPVSATGPALTTGAVPWLRIKAEVSLGRLGKQDPLVVVEFVPGTVLQADEALRQVQAVVEALFGTREARPLLPMSGGAAAHRTGTEGRSAMEQTE